MARKPSERTNRMKIDEDLNITSLMDIITNLMFYLLIFSSVISVNIIDAPLPKIASTAEEVRMAKEQENKLEVIVRIQKAGYVIQTNQGSSRTIPIAPDGKYPTKELHEFLVAIHLKKPDSKEITLIPEDSIVYNTIIETMDASREYLRGDPGFKELSPDVVSKPEALQFNRLFPDVALGGV